MQCFPKCAVFHRSPGGSGKFQGSMEEKWGAGGGGGDSCKNKKTMGWLGLVLFVKHN